MVTSCQFNPRKRDPLLSEVSLNKENIQLIWLDRNMSDSNDYRLTQTILMELNPAVQFYSNFDRCLDLIQSIKNERIFLIVSGSFARPILSQIHIHRTVVAIFIFCFNCHYCEPLLREYDKIFEIYTDQDSLLESIRKKINIVEKQTLAFSLFDQKQKAMKDLSKESASFLLNQMLIHVLRQTPQDEQSKKETLDMCRNYYQNNSAELKVIDKFRRKYICTKSIK